MMTMPAIGPISAIAIGIARMPAPTVSVSVKAKAVQKAVDDVLLKDKVRTGDLGGKASTKQFTQAVVARLK